MRSGIVAVLLAMGMGHPGLVHRQGVSGTFAIWLSRPLELAALPDSRSSRRRIIC